MRTLSDRFVPLEITHMRFARLQSIILPAIFAASASFNAVAQTAPWPSKPVTLLVATSPGNAPDLVARTIGEKLARQIGQPVVIDNRPGGNGIVAMNALRAAAPNSHTLALLHAAASVVTPFTYAEGRYDAERDVETVAIAGKAPMLFVINPGHPAKTFAEAISMAKARPDQLSVGNPTRTSIPHQMVAEGDWVAARLSSRGTHLGAIFGLDPTGRTFASQAMAFYRFDGGRVVEEFAQPDFLGLLQQLGAIPAHVMPGISG